MPIEYTVVFLKMSGVVETNKFMANSVEIAAHMFKFGYSKNFKWARMFSAEGEVVIASDATTPVIRIQ